MRERWVVLESSAFEGVRLEVRALRGTEEINRLYSYEVTVGVEDPASVRELVPKLLASEVTLRFEEGGQPVRSVHGIVAEASYGVAPGDEQARVHVTMAPRAWLATQRYGAQVFLDVSVPEVLVAKLEAIGLKQGKDFSLALDEIYPKREIIVQYEESDWALFCRLCEHEGIVFVFDQTGAHDVLRLADGHGVFPTIAGDPIPVRDRREHPAAWDVTTSLRRHNAEVLVHDYNYRAPGLLLNHVSNADRVAADGVWVEYGAHSKAPDETRRIARVRAEETTCRHELVRGKSSALSLFAGCRFVLADGLGHEDRLLLTRLDCSAHDGEGDLERPWVVELVAQSEQVPFRPERITPRPRVTGLVHATVDGEIKGHYAELDDMGRYHVRVGFDRSGRTDLGASHPVRMMQPHAGARYGMHFPLRPGTEVLMAFVDGNPDRPVIVGTAPNPLTWSPVDRGNQTQNVLRTGSNNELVIEDEIGNERIRLHTPHSDTTLQLGSYEEAEIGSLITTTAHIGEASRGVNSVAADRQTLMTRNAATLVGESAVVLAGLEGVTRAAGRGLEQPGALSQGEIAADLQKISLPPGEVPDENESGGDADEADASISAGGMWSATAAALSEQAYEAAMATVRAMAESSDTTRDESIGRHQGEPLGAPLAPALLLGSPNTSALFARDTAFVYGDRIAALSAHDSAAIVGGSVVEAKSPGVVEIAAGTEVSVTTPGLLDAAAGTMRFVAGYYPEAEAPPLDEGCSIGVMAREDLHLVSIEHCILVCAQKNLIASAHSGDMRLTADQTVSVTGGSVTVNGGSISLGSGGKTVIKAGGDVEIEGANVTIKGGVITLDGNVDITGHLHVAGDIFADGTINA